MDKPNLEVKTDVQGTSITLHAKSGKSVVFQPIFALDFLNPDMREAVREWCIDRQQEYAEQQMKEKPAMEPMLVLDDPPDTPFGMHIIVHGNPIDGINIVGPFATHEDACTHAEDRMNEPEWWIVPLEAP